MHTLDDAVCRCPTSLSMRTKDTHTPQLMQVGFGRFLLSLFEVSLLMATKDYASFLHLTLADYFV